MNALIESALVAALIVAALGLLVVAAAVSDYFTRTEPVRYRPVEDGSPDWPELSHDFFHPTGRVRTAVAFARSKSESRDVSAPGSLTSKEITRASADQ